MAFTRVSGCRDFGDDPCDGDFQLLVMNADGGGARRLATGSQPAWSPDGRRIAFTSRGRYVKVTDVDGGKTRRLAKGSGPAWSPDGRRIAFTSVDKRQGRLYVKVMDTDGSNTRRLTTTESSDPVWSPNGRRIAFMTAATATDRLCVVRVGGGNSKHRRCPAANGGQVWSPDGRRIAFTSRNLRSVKVMAADGRGVRRLTQGREPAWSPDGGWIAFSRSTPGRSNVYVARVDGTQVKQLTSPPGGSRPVWSPDGREIAFSRPAADSLLLYVMDADGGNVQQLTPRRRFQYNFGPAWFGPAPTRTTLNARPESVAKGARLSLTGRVTKLGIRLPAAQVQIRFRKVGADGFRAVTSVATSPAGRYRATVAARTSGTWKAVHRATAATLASSAEDDITVSR